MWVLLQLKMNITGYKWSRIKKYSGFGSYDAVVILKHQ